MKKMLSLLVLATILLSVCGCTVVFDSSGVFYYAFGNTTEQYSKEALISREKEGGTVVVNMVRNEDEMGQFVVKNSFSDITGAKLTVNEFRCGDSVFDASKIKAYKMHYVTRKYVSGEEYTLPWAYIPLNEFSNNTTVKMGENQGFFLKFSADESTAAGVYNGSVTLEYDGGQLEVPYSVTVYDLTIPYASTLETNFGNRVNTALDYYGSLLTSAELSQMCVDFALDHRISLSGGYVLEDTSTDEAAAKSYKKLFEQNPRISNITIGWWVPYEPDRTPDMHSQRMRRYVDALVAEGIEDKFIFYPIDEPEKNESERAYSLEVLRQLKEYFPEIRTVLTATPIEDYYNEYATLWCPFYYSSEADDILYYLNGQPLWTYFLKEDRTDAWYESGSNISGYLSWEFGLCDIWTGADWDESSGHYVSATTQQLWNGEAGGFLIPGKVGDGYVDENVLVATLKTEGVRESQEDYEKLVMFRKRAKEFYDAAGISEYTFDECLASVYANVYKAETYMKDEIPHDRLVAMNAEILDRVVNGVTEFSVIRENRMSQNPNGYMVEVFAPKGASVLIGEKTPDAAEELDGCTKYTFNMSANYSEEQFTVSVNGRASQKIYRSDIYSKYNCIIDMASDFDEVKTAILSQRRTSIEPQDIEKVEINGKTAMKISMHSSKDSLFLPLSELTNGDWSGDSTLRMELPKTEENNAFSFSYRLTSGEVGANTTGTIKTAIVRYNGQFKDISLKSIPSGELYGDKLLALYASGESEIYITSLYLGG